MNLDKTRRGWVLLNLLTFCSRVLSYVLFPVLRPRVDLILHDDLFDDKISNLLLHYEDKELHIWTLKGLKHPSVTLKDLGLTLRKGEERTVPEDRARNSRDLSLALSNREVERVKVVSLYVNDAPQLPAAHASQQSFRFPNPPVPPGPSTKHHSPAQPPPTPPPLPAPKEDTSRLDRLESLLERLMTNPPPALAPQASPAQTKKVVKEEDSEEFDYEPALFIPSTIKNDSIKVNESLLQSSAIRTSESDDASTNESLELLKTLGNNKSRRRSKT